VRIGARSLYDVLQVSRWAAPEVIYAAYRALALAYHPDISPLPGASDRMRELNSAYHVLRDPWRRALYDATLAAAVEAPRRHWRRVHAVPYSGRRGSARGSSGVVATLVAALVAALAAFLWFVAEIAAQQLPAVLELQRVVVSSPPQPS